MSHNLSNMSSLVSIGNKLGRVYDNSLILFANDPAWAGRTGSYFCLADAKTGLPIMVLSVGIVPLEKAEKYLGFCIEKARRLAAHPDHLSSWESRNPDENRWGGAIRGNYIYSLSGLPELGDEAVMMGLLHSFQPGSADLLQQIRQKSTNPYYEKLLMEFLDWDI